MAKEEAPKTEAPAPEAAPSSWDVGAEQITEEEREAQYASLELDTDDDDQQEPEPEPEADAEPKPAADGDDDDSSDADADAEPELTAEQKAAKESERKAWDELPTGIKRRITRQKQKIEAQDVKIDELMAKISETSNSSLEMEALRGEIADLKAARDVELDPDDFDSFDEYTEAKEAQAKETKAKAKAKKPEAADDDKGDKGDGDKPAAEDTPEQFIAKFGVDAKTAFEARNTLEVEAEAADPELWGKVAKLPNVSPMLLVSVSETEDPAGILEQLVEDPELATELSKETRPFAIARRIAQLEADASAPKIIPARDERARGSGEPINPVNTAGRALSEDPMQAETYEQYERAQNAQVKKSGNGGWM